MKKRIVVLGAGPGGYCAAVRAAQGGAQVTVIEQENVGGTCLNWGCIPSKIMKTSADMFNSFQNCSEFGICLESPVKLEMSQLMKRKEKLIQVQRKGILGLLSHHAIRYVNGTAIVNNKGMVSVSMEGSSVEEIPYDNLIVAVGTSPLNILSFPFDGKKILSSNDLLCLEELPKSLLILGGGVIGCEFAFILSSLGVQVSIVEAKDRLLPIPSVDESCSKLLLREMKKRKIKVYLEQSVEEVEDIGNGLKVSINTSHFSTKSSKSTEIEIEQMAVCIGRASNARKLGLEKIGVTLDNRGWIDVNDNLETSCPGVYAIGDVLGPDRVMLAHVASTEGEVAVDNIYGANRKMQYDLIPGAIFTMPEIGTVGITERQAREKGIDFRSDTVMFRTLGKAQVIGEIAGEAKLISDRTNGKILGVHIVGPHATDLLAEGVLAIQKETTSKDLAGTIHAHPTLSEIMLEVAFKADDRAMHG